MPVMFNAETGHVVPMPQDERAVMKLKLREYSVAEPLVDTTLGGEVLISAESQVQSGIAVQRCLAKTRRDEGHKGQRAFMLPSEWAKLSPAEREAFKPKARETDSTLTPKTQHVETIATQAALIAQQSEALRQLQAKVDALAAEKRK